MFTAAATVPAPVDVAPDRLKLANLTSSRDSVATHIRIFSPTTPSSLHCERLIAWSPLGWRMPSNKPCFVDTSSATSDRMLTQSRQETSAMPAQASTCMHLRPILPRNCLHWSANLPEYPACCTYRMSCTRLPLLSHRSRSAPCADYRQPRRSQASGCWWHILRHVAPIFLN